MNVGIFYREDRVPAAAAERLERLLLERGAGCRRFTREEDIAGVDRLVVLGGDGSMLRAARKCSELGLPLVGVNYGTLGFLTEFERGEEEQAASLVLDERAATVERTMLDVEVRGEHRHFLNEIALIRKVAPDAEDGVVRIAIELDGNPAGEFVADGLILSTPTGSTAYSLSAGGSILTPECAALLLTPVNAFSLRSRPIVCSDGSVLSFTVPEGVVELHGDGIFLGELTGGEKIVATKSSRHARFLSRRKYDFFRHLTEKIN